MDNAEPNWTLAPLWRIPIYLWPSWLCIRFARALLRAANWVFGDSDKKGPRP